MKEFYFYKPEIDCCFWKNGILRDEVTNVSCDITCVLSALNLSQHKNLLSKGSW